MKKIACQTDQNILSHQTHNESELGLLRSLNLQPSVDVVEVGASHGLNPERELESKSRFHSDTTCNIAL